MTIKNKKSEPLPNLDELCHKVGFNPDMREAEQVTDNCTLFRTFRPATLADRTRPGGIKVRRKDGSTLPHPIVATGEAWWVKT